MHSLGSSAEQLRGKAQTPIYVSEAHVCVQALQEVVEEALVSICQVEKDQANVDLDQDWAQVLQVMQRGFRDNVSDTATFEWKDVSSVELPAPSHKEGKQGYELFTSLCTQLPIAVDSTSKQVQKAVDSKAKQIAALDPSSLVDQRCITLLGKFMLHAKVRQLTCEPVDQCAKDIMRVHAAAHCLKTMSMPWRAE